MAKLRDLCLKRSPSIHDLRPMLLHKTAIESLLSQHQLNRLEEHLHLAEWIHLSGSRYSKIKSEFPLLILELEGFDLFATPRTSRPQPQN